MILLLFGLSYPYAFRVLSSRRCLYVFSHIFSICRKFDGKALDKRNSTNYRVRFPYELIGFEEQLSDEVPFQMTGKACVRLPLGRHENNNEVLALFHSTPDVLFMR